MTDHNDDNEIRGLRQKIVSGAEEAVGKVAQELLENSLVNGALTAVFDARHRATQAQEVAMGALNIPSAADIERLTRRLRTVSQRLEGIEESVERLDRVVAQLAGNHEAGLRLEAIERQLAEISRLLGAGSPVGESQTGAGGNGAAEVPVAAKPRKRAAAKKTPAPSA